MGAEAMKLNAEDNDPIAQLDRLDELDKQRAQLKDELRASLLLEKEFPGGFKYGSAKIRLEGPMNPGRGNVEVWKQFLNLELVLTPSLPGEEIRRRVEDLSYRGRLLATDSLPYVLRDRFIQLINRVENGEHISNSIFDR